ncbi:hypothetical protein SASPL_153679 [Salvia splendens]|uniref:Uncharacterized protein n=1 Tax=Salvia splendens TaxID=180675 RepID=A0A8X8VYS1_SALSN|nr:hypothetical protein SASPL_153679 [Salvia splendens]
MQYLVVVIVGFEPRAGYLQRLEEAVKLASVLTLMGTIRLSATTNNGHKQIVKADSNAKYMHNKAWPLFNDWKGIFGKDRANGFRAEDMHPAAEKLYGHPTPIPETQPSDYNFSLDDLYTEEQIAESLNK